MNVSAHTRGIFYFAVAVTLVSCGNDKGEGTRSRAEGGPQKGGAAAPVVVAEVRRMPVPLEIRAIGNVEALSSVQIKSRVAGPIVRVHFQEGADVRAGQLLFTIDPREFEQTVREAEATVAAQKASVGQAEATYQRDVAQAANARLQAGRYAELAGKGIVSRQENERMQTEALAAEKVTAASQANIASARAALQGAEVKMADARLQLSYTSIRAPIAGRTGAVTSKQGDLVAANGDALVTINQVSPVYVTFSIPEQELNQLRRYAQGGKLRVIATPQDENVPHDGTLDFLDNNVDQATGTILLKARFPNQQRRLWPGQFVNTAIQLATPQETVVPIAAVRNSQDGNYVFIVKPDMTAEQRRIQLARSRENLSVIAQGVEPGEKVVVEGQLRLRPNSKVQITRGVGH